MRGSRQLPLVAMLVLTILLYLGRIRICIMGQLHPMYAYPPSNGHINNNPDPSPYPPYVAQLNTYPQKK